MSKPIECDHPEARVFYEAGEWHCELCGATKPDWRLVRLAIGPFAVSTERWSAPLPAGSYIAQRLR